jgi:hypothetical protein
VKPLIFCYPTKSILTCRNIITCSLQDYCAKKHHNLNFVIFIWWQQHTINQRWKQKWKSKLRSVLKGKKTHAKYKTIVKVSDVWIRHSYIYSLLPLSWSLSSIHRTSVDKSDRPVMLNENKTLPIHGSKAKLPWIINQSLMT